MYQSLLTRRYLTSKIMPLLAAVAVTLCVAMELIVWSVMGGFLTTLLSSGRTLIGDVEISSTERGFAHYEDLIRRLEADERVVAAAPIIETFGQVSLPIITGPRSVRIVGVDGPSFAKVTGYYDNLWWKPIEKPLRADTERQDPRLDPEQREKWAELEARGRELTAPMEEVTSAPVVAAMVTGTEVGGFNERMPGGWLRPFVLLPGNQATLSTLVLDQYGKFVSQVTWTMPIANQFKTGVYEIDANTVLVRIDDLQKRLQMDAARRLVRGPGAGVAPRVEIDPATGKEVFKYPETTRYVDEPARITKVLVRGRDEIPADALKSVVENIYRQFADANRDKVNPPDGMLNIRTWEERQGTLVAAVKKETALVMFIFGVISLTSVFLVLAIFWSMVSEKTRDIGILRAMGAGRGGVAWLWLRYGLAIGLAGALLGGLLGSMVVWNINTIHDWLGEIGHRLTGEKFYIWDPAVYYFSEIPSKVDPVRAAIVICGGVLASVLGALVPAIKAARMDPVRALRWE